MTSIINTPILNASTLNDYTKCVSFIDSINGHVSEKMLTKRYNISPKIVKRILRNHSNTRLCPPREYGSNKFKNSRLYKKMTNKELIELCNSELVGLLKNKIVNNTNIKSYISSGFAYHMRNKYEAVVDNNCISKLSY